MGNISLSPEILFYIGTFPVSNSFFWMIIVTVLLLTTILIIRYKFKQVPGRAQAAFEILFEAGYNFVESIMENKEQTKKVFPLIFTLFIFILLANLMTFIPGATITFDGVNGETPFFRAVMADYGMVFVLTMISVITVQIVAIISYGPLGYIGKFINFSSPLNFFLGIMDFISELSKVISLSFRLFGNIFAAEVLGMVMLFLMPWILPLPFQILGLLTAVVQAFVFAVLTLVSISMAIKVKDEVAENEMTV